PIDADGEDGGGVLLVGVPSAALAADAASRARQALPVGWGARLRRPDQHSQRGRSDGCRPWSVSPVSASLRRQTRCWWVAVRQRGRVSAARATCLPLDRV